MKITMHGNPLTLVGTPIKTGETAPVFYGINQQMQPVSLFSASISCLERICRKSCCDFFFPFYRHPGMLGPNAPFQ